MRLPVLVSFGGVGPAGRSSAHRAYQRLVYESLPRRQQLEVCRDLAALCGKTPFSPADEQHLLDHTLIRRIEAQRFDPLQLPSYQPLPADGIGEIHLTSERAGLELPGWNKRINGDGSAVLVPGEGAAELRVNRPQELACKCAGQFPSGFEPSRFYPSRGHPLALEATVFGMSDTLGNMGLDWDQLYARLSPERIAVFSGSAISQLDGGMHNFLTARLTGGRVSSRALAMGLGGMSADFINAYILGACGASGNMVGACATWLYNLNAACARIVSGQADLAVVGAAESQVNPEVLEAFIAPNAAATDANLLQMQRQMGEDPDTPDYRNACRPFALNAGMVIGESAQFAVLMSDALALEVGARILASPLSVHVNADGYKHSISGPGMGNYLTLAQAMDSAAAIAGEDSVRTGSVAFAHGTGTPQNRTTESHLLNSCAQAFSIDKWPVMAIKARVGHSMGCASGDQMSAALGVLQYGLLPGTLTAPGPSDDVSNSHLDIRYRHTELASEQVQLAFINAKGFGGNNATAAIGSAQMTRDLLRQMHGKAALLAWEKKAQAAEQAALEHDARALEGRYSIRYTHDADVLNGLQGDVAVSRSQVQLKNYAKPVSLNAKSPFTPAEDQT